MPESGFIDITMTGVEGIGQIQRRIATYELKLNDLSEPLNLIGQDILQSNGNNFASQGGEFAGGWEPLAPSTLLKKRSGVMMVESGRLMASLTARGGDNIFNVTPTSLEVGTSVPYAYFHQYGAPANNMPARRVVGWSWNMQQLVVKRFSDFVRDMMNRP